MDKLKRVLQLGFALQLVWKSGAGWCLCSAGVILLQGILPPASLFVLKRVIDTLVATAGAGHQEGLSPLFAWIGAAAGLAVAAAVCRSLLALISEIQSQTVADYIQQRIQQKSVTLDVAFYETPEYQDTLHRAQLDARFRPLRMVNSLIRAAVNVVSLAGVAVILFSFHWLIALLLFIGMIPGLFAAFRMAHQFFLWQKTCAEMERKTNYLHWVLTTADYARECRSYTLGDLFIPRFMKLRKQLRAERLALLKSRTVSELLAQLAGVAVLFGSLAYLSIQTVAGAISVGGLIMFAQALRRAEDFFREILQAFAHLYEDSLFLQNIRQFMQMEPAVHSPEHPVTFPPSNQTGFSLKHIHFTYPGATRPVLHDINLHIAPGQRVALVGHNGSGKTTLIQLLCRFYDPQNGALEYNGIDIRHLPLDAYRRNIGVLFQNFNRYQFTVRENIQLANPSFSTDEARLEQAADRAGALEIIRRLPNGFDSQLGRWFNQGVELSHGEWQKIALARTFASEGALLLFDEPSSFLDADAEERLFNVLRTLPTGQSMLFVSHRFSTVRQADWIYVLNEGRIIEQGCHDDLIRQDGLYSRLFHQQARGYTHA